MTTNQFEEITTTYLSKAYKCVAKGVKVRIYGTTIRCSISFKWWVIDRARIRKSVVNSLTKVVERLNIPASSVEVVYKNASFTYKKLLTT